MIYFYLWLCSVIGTIGTILLVFGIVGLIVWIIAFACMAEDYSEGFRKFWKPKLYMPIFAVAVLLGAMMPSKKTCYAIMGVGATIEYAMGNEEVRKLPDNAFKALNYYLEIIFDEEKKSLHEEKQTPEPQPTSTQSALDSAQKLLDIARELNED